MAGDWITMRTDLEDDPTVVHMVTILSRSTVTDVMRQWPVLLTRLVIGCLHKFWGIADAQTIDGFLEGYTPELMDSKVGLPGFTEALSNARDPWVQIEPNGLRLPDFEEHMGDSAKKRLQDRRRQSRHRSRQAASRSSVTTVTQDGDENHTDSVTTEQKRTEQDSGDETSRDDHGFLSWKEETREAVLDFCRRKFTPDRDPVFPGKLTPEDRDFLLKLGALCLKGDLPEAWIDSGLEAIRLHDGPVPNRPAYLTTVLQELCGQYGRSLNRMLAQITLPEGGLRRQVPANPHD
jgi:hypothetical protein